ncbi:uncharacterized protein LOC119098223 [Pollicipes pollicipes]|uniref:uncharacterized protein LOC119098223 n=1 Tax=Pollicipes pollicipes TaxID=41117 RepID=UPI0018857EE9|nr:uncharacterized protein LOC119098223 [Pollicipes pollicipes]
MLNKIKYPRLSGPDYRCTVLRAYQSCERSWLRTAKLRAEAGRKIAVAVDHAANMLFMLNGLPDLAMEDLRARAEHFGSMFCRDALLDIIYPRHYHPHEHLARRHYALMLFRECERDMCMTPILCRAFRPGATIPLTVPRVLNLLLLWLAPELGGHEILLTTQYVFAVEGIVLEAMRERHPLHPINAWTRPRATSFGDTIWLDEDVEDLLFVMSLVMRSHFPAIRCNDAACDCPQQFMDTPASHGLGLLLPWIYSSVAGALGVCVYHMRITDRTVIAWYRASTDEYVVVDPTHHGSRYDITSMTIELADFEATMEPVWQQEQTPVEMVSRVLRSMGEATQEPVLSTAERRAIRWLAIWADNGFVFDYNTAVTLADTWHTQRPMYARRVLKDFLHQHGNTLPDEEYSHLCHFTGYMNLISNEQRDALNELWFTGWPDEVRPAAARPQQGRVRFRMGDVVIYDGRYLAVVYFCTAHCDASAAWVSEHLDLDTLARGLESALLLAYELWLAPEPCAIIHGDIGRYFVRFDGVRSQVQEEAAGLCSGVNEEPRRWLSPQSEPANALTADAVFGKVALGGTFDQIHTGHKLLLTAGLLHCSQELTVGVTDDAMNAGKTLRELIAPCLERVQGVADLVADLDETVAARVAPITDPFGPTADDPSLQLLVVSEETAGGAERVAAERRRRHLPPMQVYTVPLLADTDSAEHEETKLSSSSLRMRRLGAVRRPRLGVPRRAGGPYVIGLTGGAASGKSSVCRRLAALGAHVVDCDRLGHEAYEPGTVAHARLRQLFGEEIVAEDGRIDRRRLGDAAVLLEAGWDAQLCDEVWVTLVPREEAVRRAVQRDGVTGEQAERRLDAQMSNARRVEAATVVLSTLWEPEYTQRQVERAWSQLMADLGKRQ